MTHTGNCHCGQVSFEVEGEPEQVMECNCSHCSRKGLLLWFVPREQFRLTTPEENLASYTFNRHAIQHRFCPDCGTQPFAFGKDPSAGETASINVRCLEDIDLAGVKRKPAAAT